MFVSNTAVLLGIEVTIVDCYLSLSLSLAIGIGGGCSVVYLLPFVVSLSETSMYLQI